IKEFEAEASAKNTREIAIDPLAIGDSSESSRKGILDLKDTIYDIVHYMSEVRIDRITKIKTTQRQLEASQLVASEERELEEFRLVHRDRDDTRRRLRRLKSYNMTITCSGMTPEVIGELINRHVKEALAAYEEARAANALEAENQSQNGCDDDNRNGNGGNRNGGNGNGENENPNENGRGDRHVARECTYQDFMKCQPLNFKGTAANALEAENQSQNGSDDDNGNGGNGNGGNGDGGNGNGNGNGGSGDGGNGNGGNGNPNENGRGDRPVARECTYQDFMECQPLNFKGMEGVVGLIRWFEKMETVFHISNCPEKYQVKYATCTLLNSAFTWWNSHKRTIRTEAAFAMS
ncbi:hypothetical protein Tco_0980702, partial [Tanacetum coccineum]